MGKVESCQKVLIHLSHVLVVGDYHKRGVQPSSLTTGGCKENKH